MASLTSASPTPAMVLGLLSALVAWRERPAWRDAE